ncbi:MAG: cation transporter [Ruminococcaceae bacterium]|nr:cation transporter [Oscillospiraceae bacterium]
MKSEKNIFWAFILNFAFSIFEFVGGIFTGSVAILSDAIHDIGDSISIGLSFILEKISKKQPNEKYTYGYLRYSVLGSVITTFILLLGSGIVIYNAILRMLNPNDINYNGMIIFAAVGVSVNFLAAIFTKDGESLNMRAVNLHMLEDILGWIAVLIGAVVMKLTDIRIIDPILSVIVAAFILIASLKNLKSVLDLFLEKTPCGISVEKIKQHLCEIEGVVDVHHIHVRSIDGFHIYATLHIVTNADTHRIKKQVREELSEHGIFHVTIETESVGEDCEEYECHIHSSHAGHSHAHHHHH